MRCEVGHQKRACTASHHPDGGPAATLTGRRTRFRRQAASSTTRHKQRNAAGPTNERAQGFADQQSDGTACPHLASGKSELLPSRISVDMNEKIP